MIIVLDRHRAEARRRIAARHAIDLQADSEVARALRPRPPQWWSTEPNASDPLWELFIARAIEEIAWRSNVQPASLYSQAASSPLIADEIVQYAAAMLHEFAQREIFA